MTHATHRNERPARSRVSTRTLMVILYLAIPTLLAVISGVRSPAGSILGSVILWVSQNVPMWLMLAAGSQVWYEILRPWRAPKIVILLLGAATGAAFSYGYQQLTMTAEVALLLNGAVNYTLPPPSLDWTFAGVFVRFALPSLLLWLSVNYFYDLVLDIPRYRYPAEPPVEAEADADHIAPSGPFWSRLPPELGRDILALRAQEHYVAVTTTQGSALVLCRFGDALREVDDLDGLCVHRSHWIARRAVAEKVPERGGYQLTLVDGGVARVAQSRKLMFDQWLAAGPER